MHRGHPRKLTAKQIAYARQCAKVRQVTPSIQALAKQWGVVPTVVRNAVKGYTYKELA